MPAAGVLANDTDADPGTTLTAQLVSTTAHGSLTLNPDGSFVYTPQADFTGTDAFTYTASDGESQLERRDRHHHRQPGERRAGGRRRLRTARPKMSRSS